SSFHHTQTSATRRRKLVNTAQAISSCRRSGLISATVRQHRPGDAGELVGPGYDDDILVRPRQQSARPPAKRRVAFGQVPQHSSRTVDQVLAKMAIAALAD